MRRFRRVEELDWGEHAEVAGLRVESVEVRHWGARMVTDRHRGYGGYLLEKAGTYDPLRGRHRLHRLVRAAQGTRSVDLAILPIGAYDPWIANHASPEEAWRMFRAIGAEYVLPIHHSTFRLSREPVNEPLRRFLDAAGSDTGESSAGVGETWSLPPDDANRAA